MMWVVELLSKFVFVCLGTSIKAEVTGCLESTMCLHGSFWAAATGDRKFKPLHPVDAPPWQGSKGFWREVAGRLALSRSVLFLPNATFTVSKCSFGPWGLCSPIFSPICTAACTVPMGTGAKFWTPLLAQSCCPHTQFMPWAHIPNIIPVTLIPSSLGHSSCPLLLVLLEQGPCRVVIRGCLQLLLHSTRVDRPRSMLTQRWPNYSLSTVGFIRVSLSIFYFSNR